MKTVSYKGYQGSVEFEDGTLFVKVLHIDDVLIGECDAASEVQAVMEDLVDNYLADCAEIGREPAKPFKGSFNVRVSPAMHRKIAMDAASQGMSLNAWIAQAAEEKLECDRWSNRMDGVISGSQATLQNWIHQQTLKVQYGYAQRTAALQNMDVFYSGTRQMPDVSVILQAKRSDRDRYHG